MFGASCAFCAQGWGLNPWLCCSFAWLLKSAPAAGGEAELCVCLPVIRAVSWGAFLSSGCLCDHQWEQGALESDSGTLFAFGTGAALVLVSYVLCCPGYGSTPCKHGCHCFACPALLAQSAHCSSSVWSSAVHLLDAKIWLMLFSLGVRWRMIGVELVFRWCLGMELLQV